MYFYFCLIGVLTFVTHTSEKERAAPCFRRWNVANVKCMEGIFEWRFEPADNVCMLTKHKILIKNCFDTCKFNHRNKIKIKILNQKFIRSVQSTNITVYKYISDAKKNLHLPKAALWQQSNKTSDFNSKWVERRCRHTEHLAIKALEKKHKTRIDGSCQMRRMLLVYGYDKWIVFV